MDRVVSIFIARTAVGVILTMLGCAAVAPLAAAEPADRDDKIDQQLLEELGDADTETPAADDASPRPSQPPTATDTVDDDLLRELDAGEDITLAPDAESPAGGLGEDTDPVTRIGHKMRIVEGLLEDDKPQADPRKLQDQIIKDLEELIKQLQQRKRQSSSSSNSQGGKQQSGRSQVRQPGASPAGQRQAGQRESDRPADDSEDRQGAPKTPQVDMAELTEVIKAVWGHLPEKDRERLRQLSAEQIMPDHELQIEKYFRRLAEEDANAP